VYKAVNYALHPSKKKTIWSGTPFNAKDPLYRAVESGVWAVNVYPVCEQFPCSREEFKGSWEDRFSYDFVKLEYDNAVKSGKVDTFNQELMLRIMSEEERLILDSDVIWYARSSVITSKSAYNFYITTDFATSDREHADFSAINVWAHNNNGDWLWVDGICKKMLMNATVDNLFRLVQEYSPLEVGIEITGQQGGFISWIQNEMTSRNIYFNLSKGKNGNNIGIRPIKDKMSRFQENVVPLFKMKKIWFPEELKDSDELKEMMVELQLATIKGFKSKHDDQIDTISMLAELNTWKPSEVSVEYDEDIQAIPGTSLWGSDDIKVNDNSYFV
jgi:predicted phage terminase large subunit-like protein